MQYNLKLEHPGVGFKERRNGKDLFKLRLHFSNFLIKSFFGFDKFAERPAFTESLKPYWAYFFRIYFSSDSIMAVAPQILRSEI